MNDLTISTRTELTPAGFARVVVLARLSAARVTLADSDAVRLRLVALWPVGFALRSQVFALNPACTVLAAKAVFEQGVAAVVAGWHAGGTPAEGDPDRPGYRKAGWAGPHPPAAG